MSFRVRRICAMGCRRWLNSESQRPMSRHWPMAARACSLARCFGRCSTSMRRRPTPMAPDETITTRWPSLRRRTAVSTISESVAMSGSWLVASMMELVPANVRVYIPTDIPPLPPPPKEEMQERKQPNIPSLMTMPSGRGPFMAARRDVRDVRRRGARQTVRARAKQRPDN